MAELSPQTREEHFLARIAGDTNALVLEPVTRIEHFLQRIIDNGPSPGPGGEVTPASVVTATGQMTPQQAEATLGNIGGEPKKLTVNITETGGVYTADKTYAEIVSAYESSRQIVVVFDDKRYDLLETDGVDFLFGSVASSTIYALLSRPQGWVYAAYNIQMKPTIVTDLSSTSITIASAADNTIYEYGELTALTISSIPASGWFSVVFTSGATATVLTVPNSMIMPDGFAVEANTRYEINCKDGYAVAFGWPVSI